MHPIDLDLDSIDFDDPTGASPSSLPVNKTLGRFVLVQVANGFALHVMKPMTRVDREDRRSPLLCSYVTTELSEVPNLMLGHIIANKLST